MILPWLGGSPRRNISKQARRAGQSADFLLHHHPSIRPEKGERSDESDESLRNQDRPTTGLPSQLPPPPSSSPSSPPIVILACECITCCCKRNAQDRINLGSSPKHVEVIYCTQAHPLSGGFSPLFVYPELKKRGL